MKTYWLCILFGHRFITRRPSEEFKDCFERRPSGWCEKCGRTKEEIFKEKDNPNARKPHQNKQ